METYDCVISYKKGNAPFTPFPNNDLADIAQVRASGDPRICEAARTYEDCLRTKSSCEWSWACEEDLKNGATKGKRNSNGEQRDRQSGTCKAYDPSKGAHDRRYIPPCAQLPKVSNVDVQGTSNRCNRAKTKSDCMSMPDHGCIWSDDEKECIVLRFPTELSGLAYAN